VWWRAPDERLAEVADRLLQEGVRGRRVAMQLHGGESDQIGSVLRDAGAEVVTVRVYRWRLPDNTAPVRRLLTAVASRKVDAVTFTSAPAVANLFTLADGFDLGEAVRAAFDGGVVAACVGPVCREAARAEGLSAAIAPARG